MLDENYVVDIGEYDQLDSKLNKYYDLGYDLYTMVRHNDYEDCRYGGRLNYTLVFKRRNNIHFVRRPQ